MFQDYPKSSEGGSTCSSPLLRLRHLDRRLQQAVRCSIIAELAFVTPIIITYSRLRVGNFNGDFQTFRYATVFWKARGEFAVFH
jgi:hypothetical protein